MKALQIPQHVYIFLTTNGHSCYRTDSKQKVKTTSKSQNHLNCKNNNKKITPQSLQRKKHEDLRPLHSISEKCSAHFLIPPSQTLEVRTLLPKPLLVTAAAGASSG